MQYILHLKVLSCPVTHRSEWRKEASRMVAFDIHKSECEILAVFHPQGGHELVDGRLVIEPHEDKNTNKFHGAQQDLTK